jgi:type I restriction enzyme, S subunit
MKSYPSYRDSGIEWIGRIPKHWKLKKLKYLTTCKRDKSEDGSEELLAVSEYKGVVRRKTIREGEEHLTRSESLEGYIKVSKGNLVNNIMLMWKRALGVSNYEGIVSPAYSVFEFRDTIPKYQHYLLRTDLYITEFRKNSTGVIDSRLRLYDDDFGNIFSFLPPLLEQKIIIEYLDYKTGLIDKLIEKTKKKIELLKERRTGLINHCVTKGLNSGVEMQDSGIDWIGKIPSHWSMIKLKYLGDSIIGLTYGPENIVNDKSKGVLVLRASNINNGAASLNDNIFVNSKVKEKLITREGDILICSRSGSRSLIGKNRDIIKSCGLT